MTLSEIFLVSIPFIIYFGGYLHGYIKGKETERYHKLIEVVYERKKKDSSDGKKKENRTSRAG